jgi:hypothetical protein
LTVDGIVQVNDFGLLPERVIDLASQDQVPVNRMAMISGNRHDMGL